jgi:hypothetical protein
MKNTFRTTFDGSTNPIASYDANRVNIGTLIRQYIDSGGSKYLQPLKYEPYNAYIYSNNNARHDFFEAISWSDDIDYVFSTNAFAYTQVMTIYLHKYSRSTGKYWGEGVIQLAPNWAVGVNGNLPVQTRAYIYRHTDGTVSVSGSTVTGSGTTFQSSGIAAGARIGFDTTDHTQVKSWYEIASISSDGALTLLGTPGTIPAGTSYVIEELRIALINQRNGNFDWQGLILIKGLNEFTFGARVQRYIPQATTVDNIRAFYKLDPGTSFFPASIGGAYYTTLALDEPISNSQHDCYVMCRGTASATTTADVHFGQQLQIMKYNLRAPLTFVAPPTGYTASSTSAFVFKTGMQYVNWYFGAFLGNDFNNSTSPILGGNSMCIATPNHGPTKGKKTLFILTYNRLYACLMSEIYAESQTFLEHEHIYYPPGGKNEYFYTAAANGTYPHPPTMLGSTSFNYYQFVYSQSGDYLLSRSSALTTLQLEKFGEPGAKKYAFPWLYRYVNQFSDPRAGEYFSNNDAMQWIAFCRGILHVNISNASVAGYNHYYAIPVDCDSEHAIQANQLVILPKYGTPDCLAFHSAKVYTKNPCDDDTMRMPAGEVRLYYRTSGIDSNTGTWSRVPDNGDLSRISTADQIQFAFSWEILSITGVVPYVYSMDFCYEDGTTDEHYFPSKEKTSLSGRMLVFRQCQKWNSAIPNLRIRIYNDDTGFLVMDDTVSASNYGDWAYSTDGYSWSAWSSSADAVGNWIRYTADSLPADMTIRVLLTT